MRVDLPDGGLFEAMPMVMEPMEQALRTIEAHCEDRLGWDAKPIVLCVAGDPLSAVVMSSVEVPDFVYMNPGEGLPLFVEILTNKDLGVVGDMLRAHLKASLPPLPLLALVLVYEAWAVHADSREELESIKVTPSQHPDRIEVRDALMVTVDGRILMVGRQRGQEPRFDETDMTIGRTLSGRVPDAMRRLLDIMETLSREHAE